MKAEVMSGVKSFACGVAALALTAAFSWSFVESTAVARWNTSQATVQVADAAFAAAQAGVAVLVD